jgi:hypothetical protein
MRIPDRTFRRARPSVQRGRNGFLCALASGIQSAPILGFRVIQTCLQTLTVQTKSKTQCTKCFSPPFAHPLAILFLSMLYHRIQSSFINWTPYDDSEASSCLFSQFICVRFLRQCLLSICTRLSSSGIFGPEDLLSDSFRALVLLLHD